MLALIGTPNCKQGLYVAHQLDMIADMGIVLGALTENLDLSLTHLVASQRQRFNVYYVEHSTGVLLVLMCSSTVALSYNVIHSLMIQKTSAVTTTVLGEVKIVGLLLLSALLLGKAFLACAADDCTIGARCIDACALWVSCPILSSQLWLSRLIALVVMPSSEETVCNFR